MLRREADGVAWFAARRRMAGAPVDRPRLALSWTSHSTAAAAADALPVIVELVEGRLSALGVGVEHLHTYVAGNEGCLWTRERFDDCRRRLAEGDSLYLILLWADRGTDATDIDAKPAAELHIRLCAADPAVWTGHVLMPSRLAAGGGLDAVAEDWVRLLADLEPIVTPVWAAITYDSWNDALTPFEAFYKRSRPRAGQDADRHPRGYCWANLLTAEHIARLGGTARVVGVAGELGLSVEVLADAPGAEKVLVRDPGAITAFDDSRLEAVRDLFSPILPDCRYTWYGGPAVRVIREPGTAFRTIPPEIANPLFEDDPKPRHLHLYTRVPD
jgi:hypothetical protein